MNSIENQEGFHMKEVTGDRDIVVEVKMCHMSICRYGFLVGSSDLMYSLLVVFLSDMGTSIIKLALGMQHSSSNSSVVDSKLDQSGLHGVRESRHHIVMAGNTPGAEFGSHSHGGFHKERGARGSGSKGISLIMV